MKILFVPPIGLKIAADYKSEFQMAAIEQQVFGIAKELAKKGNNVFIMRAWAGSKKVETLSGVNLINIDLSTTQRGFQERLAFVRTPIVLIEHLLFMAKAYKRMRELNPDVINVSNIFTGYFVYLLSGNSKKVFITHDHDIYLGGGIFSSIRRKMLQRIVKNSNKVVTLNDDIKKYLNSRGFKVDEVIPNAIDLTNYKMNCDSSFVMFAGRLVSHKKVEDLIDVYYEMHSKYKHDLVIIGDGPCRKYLENHAESKGIGSRIHFISFLPRSKYQEYLSMCSFFAFPSAEEAFGVVIIEAMASGKPVIARNIIGPKGIISHAYNGFLFNNKREFADYMNLLLINSDLRKEMGDNARKTVEQKFTFDRISEAYLRLYNSFY